MAQGSREAVRRNDDLVGAAEVRDLQRRIHVLERMLGKKTLEVEILREALAIAQAKKPTLQLSLPPENDSR